jgi:hypothetical protein
MKKKIKYGSLFIAIAMATVFAVPAMAERENGLNSYPESKFVDRFSSSGLRAGGEGEGGIDLGDEPEEDLSINYIPVGDAIGLVLALSLTYGVYVCSRKRENVFSRK